MPKKESEAAGKAAPSEYTLLKNLILSGKIMPNERIVEADYAEKFKTNRANIRNALARLEQDGLVVSTAFRGARVRLVSAQEAVEIFEVRGVVETLLVRQAAEKAQEDDGPILKAQLAKVRVALSKGDPMGVGAIGRRVREEIWRISGNETAAKVVRNLNTQLVRLWYHSIMMPGRAESIYKDLEEMVDCIIANEPAKAVKAARRYHDDAVRTLKLALESREHYPAEEDADE